MKHSSRSISVLTLLLLIAVPLGSLAGTPARFYWKDLIGIEAFPVIYMDMSGNANPLDPSHRVEAETSFEAQVAIAGYARTFTAFDQSAMAAVLVPVGRVSASSSVNGLGFSESANGLGDPTFEFVVNMIGSDPIMNIPDAIRYEPGFSMDLLVDVIAPLGEYDEDKSINLGQNRWMSRVGTPIVWQLGDWIPGRRAALELLPSIWFFGDNDDFVGGDLSTDPKFQLEGHLTRDFHQNFWGSFDFNWMKGAESSVNGIEGDEIDVVGVGFTFGYQINANLQFTGGYMASINDNDPGDLSMDSFMLTLVFGQHPLVEGMKRLEGE
ncbi:transporter [Gammaproteobacteria bacterium]|nr:transporter [Gammaproteobacteria bacterium]